MEENENKFEIISDRNYKKTYKQFPCYQFPVIEQQYAKPCKT